MIKSIIVAMLLLFLAFPIFAADLHCDFNGDGKVNVIDLQMIVNVILGFQPSEPKFDVNGDGKINVLDLQYVINAILNAPRSRPNIPTSAAAVAHRR